LYAQMNKVKIKKEMSVEGMHNNEQLGKLWVFFIKTYLEDSKKSNDY
jgi:hypothetical protein